MSARGHSKQLAFVAITLTASLAFSLVLAEVILRMLGYAGAPVAKITNRYRIDDPILDWRYVGGSEYQAGRVVYQYNQIGFRDVDHPIQTPSGMQRIIVLGDSVTEGYGVEWDGVFTPVLQAKLGSTFDVLSIAQGGLNTPQEVHLFEQVGPAYRPDIVILNFVLNDCDFATRMAAAEAFNAQKDERIGLLFDMPVDPRLKRALKSSAAIYLLKQQAENLKARLLDQGEQNYFARIWNEEENRQKVARGFEKLAELQAEHGFDVLVLIWPILTDYESYPVLFAHRWVREAAEGRGFAVIDLMGRFSDVPYRRLQVSAEDIVHPNAIGHEIAAEEAAAWVGSRSPLVSKHSSLQYEMR